MDAEPIDKGAKTSPSRPVDARQRVATMSGLETAPVEKTEPGVVPSFGKWFRQQLLRILLLLPNFILLIVLLAVWQFASKVWIPSIDPYMAVLMPAPTTIAVTAAGMIVSGELFYHLMASLKREAVAFLFAACAIPLGIAMGWWRLAYNQVNPVMEILRPIPPLAWIPLSILWFGIGDEQNEFIIFLGIFFPILINTIVGVKNIDPLLIRAARSLGAPERKLLVRIVFIGALPQIITGVRIGLGVGWMALVAAELVGANSGLGFIINDARSMLRTDTIIVGMLAIGIVGLSIDTAILALGRRLLPWSLAMRK
ncbi:MAG: ABC transporter permease [Bradyrhizobium sp.]|uniref:ABC transporter permease n=1 Tax=Bradyrhizobium sp. TaxID=376 RepID=UPI0011FCB440|nr:ABC transporter permease [Bradyrhizobium sp.]THD68690.1 MAG: ABC transporter permease [Bradyrhizobium sp.]